MRGAETQPQQSGAGREPFEDIKAFSDAEAQLFSDHRADLWSLWNGSDAFCPDVKTKQPSITSEETDT
jgi:hypothetical protein